MKGLDDIVRRFLSILGAGVLTMAIAFVATPVIVRLLEPSGYGDYAVVLSIYSLYMIPVSSGITLGTQKFIAEDRDDPYWREHVIAFYGFLAIVTVALGLAVLVSFTALGGAAAVFDPAFTRYLYLLSGLILVAQVFTLGHHALLGMSLEVITGPLVVAKKAITVGVGILLVLYGLHVEGMIVGHIVANGLLLGVAAYWISSRITVSRLFRRWPESFPVRTLLSFNLLNILLVLLVTSLYHVDIIMLRTLTDAETTGFYRAALALAEYLWIVPIALKTVLIHSTSTLWSNDRRAAITTISARVTRYTVLLVLLMAIGIAVLADRFVPFYFGPEFTVAIVPMLLLLPGAVGFAVARPLKSISQASGRMRILVGVTAIAAVLNLGLNALLIPAFGMHGAALATSVSYGSMFGLYVWAAWRIGYNPLAEFRASRIAATALLAAPVIWLFDRMIAVDLVAFVVVPIVGLGVYGIAALATGAVDERDLNPLVGQLPSRWRHLAERAIIRLDRL